MALGVSEKFSMRRFTSSISSRRSTCVGLRWRHACAEYPKAGVAEALRACCSRSMVSRMVFRRTWVSSRRRLRSSLQVSGKENASTPFRGGLLGSDAGGGLPCFPARTPASAPVEPFPFVATQWTRGMTAYFVQSLEKRARQMAFFGARLLLDFFLFCLEFVHSAH